MWLHYLILGQKSHLPEKVSPSAPTSYGTVQLSPAWTWLLQHYGSWSQDEKLAHRKGKLSHGITFSKRYHCATFKWFCLEYTEILAEILHSLLFPGVFPYLFKDFLQSAFFHGNKQIFFSGLHCTCTKQKTQSSTANRFFKKSSNNQI